MEELNRHQKAALVSGIKRRQKSLQEYYENPNICRCCNKPIMVDEKQKVREVRRKVFCDHSCSATFNNQQRGIKEPIKKNKEPRPKKKNKESKPKKEKFEFILGLTKKDLFEKHEIYYRFRAVIRKHAHYIFNKHYKDQKCKVCGYNTHVEVCHIKSVSSFSDDTLIIEINSIDNLVGLCPNHHWEFDNGKIKL
jgi:predicted restriction endonuclease